MCAGVSRQSSRSGGDVCVQIVVVIPLPSKLFNQNQSWRGGMQWQTVPPQAPMRCENQDQKHPFLLLVAWLQQELHRASGPILELLLRVRWMSEWFL